ncbi:hypothetical protein Dimus_006030 [Dionaea muscipula]
MESTTPLLVNLLAMKQLGDGTTSAMGEVEQRVALGSCSVLLSSLHWWSTLMADITREMRPNDGPHAARPKKPTRKVAHAASSNVVSTPQQRAAARPAFLSTSKQRRGHLYGAGNWPSRPVECGTRAVGHRGQLRWEQRAVELPLAGTEAGRATGTGAWRASSGHRSLADSGHRLHFLPW